MDTSEKSDAAPERATRRCRTLEEKLAIVKEASQSGASVAAVARKYGVNANLVFGWIRLQQRGLLESQRHGRPAPLLPVKVTTPTLTPAERVSKRVVRTAHRSDESLLEILLPDGVRIRLAGEAQHAVLERVLRSLRR